MQFLGAVSGRILKWAVVVALVAATGAIKGQSEEAKPPSIADLNMKGAETGLPGFDNTVFGDKSAGRLAMYSHGFALSGFQTEMFTLNILKEPVDRAKQSYIGESLFLNGGVGGNVVWDMRQLHLKDAQFYLAGTWNWVSWNPGGPKAAQIFEMTFYKSFARDRVELKAGYMGNNLEIIGLSVGGSAASGNQGVYAALPFELGSTYFPLTAPGVNLRLQAPKHVYLKTSAQRSLDPEGGPAEVRRNHVGLRFAPHGDKLLAYQELGLSRDAARDVRYLWLRGGFMYNCSDYKNLATGKKDAGNHLGLVLGDVQLNHTRVDKDDAGNYVGASAMWADSRYNPFDRYYEVRGYRKAPFASRKDDMVALVASYTTHSHYLTDRLVAEGKKVWRNGASLTAAYSMRMHPGQYLNGSIGYLRGLSITPKAEDALNLSLGYMVFF